MARGINKVILVGTCGQDPEVRYLPNGTAVTNLSLATSEQWTDKQSGQKVEKTEWHRVSLFGKIAEIAANTCARVRRSTLRASCKPASGKRMGSSVTARKSSWTCKAPCNCSAAGHRATPNKGRTATAAAAVITRSPLCSKPPSRRHPKNRPAEAKPHKSRHVHQASRIRPKRLHRNLLGILTALIPIFPSWTPTGSTGCWSDPPTHRSCPRQVPRSRLVVTRSIVAANGSTGAAHT